MLGRPKARFGLAGCPKARLGGVVVGRPKARFVWWGVLKRGLVGHPRARLVEHPNQSQKSEVWFGGASYSEVGWSILILNKSRFGGVS